MNPEQERRRAQAIPPQSLEAEMALIGALLVDNHLIPAVAEVLSTADFYAPAHQTIYESIQLLHADGAPCDRITLAEHLQRRGQLKSANGGSYLSLLLDSVQTAGTAQYLATIVKEKATGRELIRAGTDIVRLGYESEADVAGALSRAEGLLRPLLERGRMIGSSSKWKLDSAADIFDQGVAPLRYDIDQLLPSEDGPAIFFGPPASLKSYLALHAAWCSVSGRDFLGHFPVRRRPQAVYVNLDAGSRTFRRRILKCGFKCDNLHIASPGAYDRTELGRIFEIYPGAFIVVDSLADCYVSNSYEDQAQAMRRFIRDLRALYSKYDANGIIVDHPRRPRDKDSTADYHGSVQKEATARIMWAADRLAAGSDQSEVKIRILCRKMSEGEPFEPFVAKVRFAESVTFAYDGALDAATGRVAHGPTPTEVIERLLQDAPGGMSRSSISSRTGFSRDAALLALKQSNKIHTHGNTRNRRYYIPDSTALMDEFRDESTTSSQVAQNGPSIRTDLSAPLRVRINTNECSTEHASLASNVVSDESGDETDTPVAAEAIDHYITAIKPS